MERRSDKDKMFIQADPSRLEPVNFEQFVEELCRSLLQVAKLSALVFLQLNVGMFGQHIANQETG